MQALGIRLFGRIEVTYSGQSVEIKSRKAQALLTYLAITRRAHSRDRLAVLFWPEADEKRARNSLSRVLYQLNQTPLAQQLESSADNIQMRSGSVWVDVHFFEDLIRAWRSHEHQNPELCAECLSNLSEAVGLYPEDFLAEFYLSDANEFEVWSTAQRERLRRSMLNALDALAQAYLERAEFDRARRFARRQLEVEDLREPAIRLLLEALARSGHRREALAEFERFKAHLWAELAVEVSPTTQALADDIRAGKLDPQPVPLSAAQTAIAKQTRIDRRPLRILLDKVDTFWVQGVLENSLHGAALIELGKELRPGEVDYPWGLVMQRPGNEIYELPGSLSMADVFDDNGQALLILGEPGSGKSTMMLDLARTLIRRARKDEKQPIPVVFNLSSWRGSSLMDWLQRELNEKYLIPNKIGRQWLDEDQLLLLLDGLDEVGQNQRGACVEAINQYRQEHGLVSLVVCSRTEEYEALAVKLKLENALLLQPLTDEQLERYFSAAGDSLGGVRQIIEEDEHTRDMARSPLMLSVLTLAYQDVEKKSIVPPAATQSSRDQLFSVYIKRMFERRGTRSEYAKEDTIGWLSWLARTTKSQGESLFLIERLQPSWLATIDQQRSYVYLSRIIAVTFFLTVILLARTAVQVLIFSENRQLIHLPERIWNQLTVGIVMGLLMATFYRRWASRTADSNSTLDRRASLAWRQIGSFVIVFICGVLAVSLVLLIDLPRLFLLGTNAFNSFATFAAALPQLLTSGDFLLLFMFTALVFG
ncbi:MAG: BTAD domain-containing putative transcriptional regulator, partial [Candidatus Promineifilaceae bacterium]|nr:BTAD domain-containing putative transcriptional regulator [Candidatus Promineifilaceae bacterium]